jgi:hypothetical protein
MRWTIPVIASISRPPSPSRPNSSSATVVVALSVNVEYPEFDPLGVDPLLLQ